MGTMTGLFRRGRSWVIDKWINGSRVYCSLGDIPQREAERQLSKKINDAMDGKRLSGRRSLTVHDILSTFWETKLKHQASAAHAPYLLSQVDDHLGSLRVSDLAVADLIRYARGMLSRVSKFGRPYSYRTVEAGLDLLNSALVFAVRNRDIPQNPVQYWKPEIRSLWAPRERAKAVLLDNGADGGPQWRSLYNTAGDTLKPILVMLYETGMRKRECLMLRWVWIDMVAGVINLPGHWDKVPVTKSRKGRTVPLSGAARSCLAGIVRGGDRVFSVSRIEKGFRAACRRAGIDDRFTVHCLRKQRATIWNQTDEYAAMRALGHDDQKTHRDRYAQVTGDRLQGLVTGPCGTFAGLLLHKTA